MFAQQSPGAGYSYGDETPEEATAMVPPYPAQMTEAGAEPATATAQQPLPPQDTLGPRDSANRTTTFSAPPRSPYLAGGAAARGRRRCRSQPGIHSAAQADGQARPRPAGPTSSWPGWSRGR